MSGFDCTQVRKALGAKHVISVCSSLDSSRATLALQRLLDNAETISGMVNLAGVAIHPCIDGFPIYLSKLPEL